MKQKLLLTLFIASIYTAVNAQKSSVYAITGTQKGQNNWTEVRLMDVTSGAELKTVFKSSEETQPLNARTGKPVAKKDLKTENLQVTRYSPDGNIIITADNNVRVLRARPELVRDYVSPTVPTSPSAPMVATKVREDVARVRDDASKVREDAVKVREEIIQKIIAQSRNSDQSGNTLRVTRTKDGVTDKYIIENNGQVIKVYTDKMAVTANTVEIKDLVETKVQGQVMKLKQDVSGLTATKTIVYVRNMDDKMHVTTNFIMRMSPSMDMPFSTYSAACAYDKKHERLYYTPLGIAQLRYIDLKAKTSQVYYFEDEPFGALRGRGDVSNQITRMVIGADGSGYALTNNAEHLIRFTTDKKAIMTDLGGLTDAPENGNYTVHSSAGYGGDIIAAKTGDLYLITANHNIFQIDMKSMIATYKGTIEGLPRGYTTNGAAVEEGTMVLVNSSNSTQGYYHFDINKLAAEKVSNSDDTYNASDLASANLLTVQKKKEEQPQVVAPIVPVPAVTEQAVDIAPGKNSIQEGILETKLSVYPNPVTNHLINLLLENYIPGKYQAKLIDVSGKQLSAKSFTINSKSHSEPFNLSPSIAKGSYLIQIYDQSTKSAGVVKLVVQ